MADTWKFSITELVESTKVFFEGRGLTYGVDYGMKSITRNLNEGTTGRVAYELRGGSYVGPKQMGQTGVTGRASRRTYTLMAEVAVHIWAWDPAALENDTAQETAWLIAHEHTLAALWAFEGGQCDPARLEPYRGPVQLNRGIARVVVFSVEQPVNAKLDRDRVKVDASVSIGLSHKASDGSSTTHIVRQFEVAAP